MANTAACRPTGHHAAQISRVPEPLRLQDAPTGADAADNDVLVDDPYCGDELPAHIAAE
jgi:hypothetical protein